MAEYFSCPGCRTSFPLLREEGDEHHAELLVRQPMACPKCSAAFLEFGFARRQGYDEHAISAKNLWLAVNEMGFPEDREFCDADVVEMLTQSPIVYVSAKMKRTGRVQIEYLSLASGKRLHFGDGAVIYKIEEVEDGRQCPGLRDEAGEPRAEEHAAGGEAPQRVDVAADRQER